MTDTAIDLDAILHAVSYDPLTGDFRWRTSSGRQSAGSIAGGVRGNGYWYICIKGKSYLAHRLAWMLTHGYWPAHDVDHIDRNPLNNRIANLREASRTENNGNAGLFLTNKSGYRGVSWDARRQKWAANIHRNNRKRFLGYFNDPRLAAIAYDEAASAHFGDFAYLNQSERIRA